ncbi:MAG: PEGA domain-containing protein [Candidatus Aminicenantes bacterium]|nr:PEGA domain-containing protein [Candidatus Aminicenantes bacterium]
MKDKKFRISRKIFYASSLSILLIFFLPGCKETPTAPELPEFAQGSIQVNSNPGGAAIWLDNKNTLKTTPALLTNILVGSHTLKLTKSHYHRFERNVTVQENQTTIINAELERILIILISPEDGAVLDNGRYDRRDDIVWDFDWADVVGATKYHLYVKHTGSLYPAINREVYGSSYHEVGEGSYIINRNRFNWKWKVRAFIDGMWSQWSEERSFDVEPIDTDPPS